MVVNGSCPPVTFIELSKETEWEKKICQSHAGENGKMETEIDGRRCRRRQAVVCPDRRQTLSVPPGRKETRDLISTDRGRFILLIRAVIKYIVGFALSLSSSISLPYSV